MGPLITTVAEAQKLPFVNDKTRKSATVAEIKTDYDAVSKQPKNRLASFYKTHTKLTLSQTDIDKLTNAHIEKFYKELKRVYPDFDTYPEEVRLALFDLIFNVGMTDLRTSWPTLNKAIKEKDWQKAAANSARKPPVSAARNTYVKELLEKAANNAVKK